LVLPLVGLVVVVLSIQRTVWAATLVAAAVLVMTRQKSRGSKSRATPRLLVVAAVVAVVLLIAAGPPGVTNSLTAGYQQTSTEQGSSTFSFRLQGWSILINRQITGPPVDLVIGSPSGTGYERVIDGITFTVAPHSEYVTALDETGILGVALLVWAYVTALRKSRRRLRSPSAFVGNVALLFTALLALQLTYFIGYSEGAIVGLMLGLACGFVHGSPPRGPSVTDLADRPALTS
jgi:O-antigen ligase